MSKMKKRGATFFLFMALLCGSIGIASSRTTTAAQAIPVVQEVAVVGASGAGCSFAEGLAVGLGVGGLFGCVPCAVGAVVIGLGALIACS